MKYPLKWSELYGKKRSQTNAFEDGYEQSE